MRFQIFRLKSQRETREKMMAITISIFLSGLMTQVMGQEGSEEERLGFFPDVPEVECECAINVQLKGDERQMTWTDSSSK